MATTTSFKQQCPSCEAMVPIRDPGLIGRKIDCPKCKYRFVVEKPADADEEADEKTKPGSTAVTNKPGAKGKGGKASPRRGDEDGSPGRKKAGNSKMLILGIGLAVVALGVLGVGGYFLFIAGDDAAAKATISRLVEAGSMRAIDAGLLSRARQLEGMGFLGITVQGPLGAQFMSAWKLLFS